MVEVAVAGWVGVIDGSSVSVGVTVFDCVAVVVIPAIKPAEKPFGVRVIVGVKVRVIVGSSVAVASPAVAVANSGVSLASAGAVVLVGGAEVLVAAPELSSVGWAFESS